MKPEQREIERLRREVAKLKAERDIPKKGRSLPREGSAMKFVFIAKHLMKHPILVSTKPAAAQNVEDHTQFIIIPFGPLLR